MAAEKKTKRKPAPDAPPKRRGRPAFKPTPEQRKMVTGLSAVGIRHEDIALYVGIDDKTLRLHFRGELDRGTIEANAKVGQRLFAKALAGDTASMIFWMKARAGWSEKIQTQALGKDGNPTDPVGHLVIIEG